MNVREVTFDEYKKIVVNPFTIFDSSEFNFLNKNKVDKVNCLIFSDTKDRAGLIVGLKDGVIKAPFSAPFSCFSIVSKKLKISVYLDSVTAFVEYAKKINVKKIQLTLPPMSYDEDHLSKICNALYVDKFRISGSDLSYQYDLGEFSDEYESSIDIKARQKLRASIKNKLVFSKSNDVEVVYNIIRKNRDLKGYSLNMFRQDILETASVVKIDYFLVHTEANEAVASAIAYHVTDKKIQVVYWGNLVESNKLKPMNFLAYKMLGYYKKEGHSFFDAGPSTEFSIPNIGLCDFKQAIGCSVSSKFSFELDI